MGMMLYRFVKGPDAPNRILALDTLTVTSLSLFLLFALIEGRSIYLDVALLFAFAGFIGVVLFGRFLLRGV